MTAPTDTTPNETSEPTIISRSYCNFPKLTEKTAPDTAADIEAALKAIRAFNRQAESRDRQARVAGFEEVTQRRSENVAYALGACPTILDTADLEALNAATDDAISYGTRYWKDFEWTSMPQDALDNLVAAEFTGWFSGNFTIFVEEADEGDNFYLVAAIETAEATAQPPKRLRLPLGGHNYYLIHAWGPSVRTFEELKAAKLKADAEMQKQADAKRRRKAWLVVAAVLAWILTVGFVYLTFSTQSEWYLLPSFTAMLAAMVLTAARSECDQY